MGKRMAKFGALLMVVTMMASPASYVRAAEGMEGAEAAWEDVQEAETEVGDGMEISDDEEITTYGLVDRIYIVMVRSAKIWSGPGTSYLVVGTLKQKTIVKGTLFRKKWVKTKYDNKTVYVSLADLKESGK